MTATTHFTLDLPVLRGTLVRLEPLSPDHAADLAAAAEEDRSTYDWADVPRAQEIPGYLAAQLARPGLYPYAVVRQADGRAVGSTSYWSPRLWPERDALCALEIGWTWLGASAQRTGINVEAKLLLMTYAFETLKCARVDLKTDARNERSRTAIGALGTTFEGILRQWSPSRVPGEEGLLRDSAIFSAVIAEWPEVKAGLERRLQQGGRGVTPA